MIQVELTLQVQPLLVDEGLANAAEVLSGNSEQQWQQWFEQWLNCLDPGLSALDAYEVSLLLTTDAEIHHFNATYRHQDTPTDVLAFAALEWEGPVSQAQAQFPINLGDIVISVETAMRQAGSHSLLVELAWLASHGLLHLLGWDHPDAEQLNRMLAEQAHLIELIGLEAPAWSSEKLGYV
jgi:probable rRNA maturation factor